MKKKWIFKNIFGTSIPKKTAFRPYSLNKLKTKLYFNISTIVYKR